MATFKVDWHAKPKTVMMNNRLCKFKSQTEYRWAEHLEFLRQCGEIKDWRYEPETFWFHAIKRGVRSYKPDFRVQYSDGECLWHEVKVWLVQKDITKFRRMSRYYPEEKLILVMARRPKRGRTAIKTSIMLQKAKPFLERIVFMNELAILR